MGKKIRRIMEGEVALPFRASQAGILSYVTTSQKRAALLGLVLFCLFSIVYLYGVISSVMHVAAREQLSYEIKRLSSEVAQLEAEYLTRTDGITESFAHERGFVAITERSFVESSGRVTFNNTR